MLIKNKYFLLLTLLLQLRCTHEHSFIDCKVPAQEVIGDTLVYEKTMDGRYSEDFNFVRVYEKYYTGITDELYKDIVTLSFYNNSDTITQNLKSFILKKDSTGAFAMDYVAWTHIDTSVIPEDKSLPYIINPITGDINRIKDGIVIRKKLSTTIALKIIEHAKKIEDWHEIYVDKRNHKEPIYMISLSIDKYKMLSGFCHQPKPKSISTLIDDFNAIP